MHRFMDELCLNCNKFSHCNNNDLICVAKYAYQENINEQLKESLAFSSNLCKTEHETKQMYKQALDDIKNVCENECIEGNTGYVVDTYIILHIINNVEDGE